LDTLLSSEKQVYRRGDTVLRPLCAETGNIGALLAHLSAKGIAAPSLRYTTSTQAAYSFMEGNFIHPKPWSDAALAEVAGMIRHLHRAVVDFQPPQPGVWRSWCLREIGGAQRVISHGDIAPWNMVCRQGMPVALIDWEMAGPIDPMVELARAIWLFVQLHDDDLMRMYGLPDAACRARQVRLMADRYGLTASERRGMFERILEVVICETAHEAIDPGLTPEQEGPLWGFAWRTRSLYWIWRHRDLLHRALTEEKFAV
jgi:hypothetical protein